MNNVVEFPEQDYDDIKCCGCAFVFSVPESFVCDRRADHKLFWCPKCGASQHFAEPEVEKLCRRIAELEAQLAKSKAQVAELTPGRRLTLKEQITGHVAERSRR